MPSTPGRPTTRNYRSGFDQEIDVEGRAGYSVEYCRNAADHHVLNVVLVQAREYAL